MYTLDEVLIHLAPNKIIKAFRYFVFEHIIQIINLPQYLWKYSTDDHNTIKCHKIHIEYQHHWLDLTLHVEIQYSFRYHCHT
jgi:hypothetical protein